jgi:prepilin-type N-terminal cleavage/methylation domain-containing protein
MKTDDGFTLVELILTMVISSIIMGALASSIIVGLKTTDDTQQRLAESHDAQIAAAYFVNDVQSADYVSLPDIGCVQAGETPLVTLEWFDAGFVKTAAYFVASAGTERRLSRRFCLNDASTGTTTTDSLVTIAHFLSTSTDPSVVCDPSCPATGTSKPTKVTISIVDSSGYSFDLAGARRVG